MRYLLSIIIVFYFLLSLGYCLVVPFGYGPDEKAHLDYITYLDEHRKLPVLGEPGVAHQAQHPPLYYLICLILYKFFIKIYTEKYVYLTFRMFSILIVAGTIILSYKIAKVVFPDDWLLPLGVAGFVSFVPMHTFIASVINNDNLVNFLVTVFLFLGLSIINCGFSQKKLLLKRYVWAGVIAGLSILTKESGLLCILLLIALFLIKFLSYKLDKVEHIKEHIRGVTTGLIIGLLISSFWYIRNFIVYGQFQKYFIWDITPFNVRSGISPQKTKITIEVIRRLTLFKGLWGVFGWLNIQISNNIYVILGIVSVLSFVGLLLFLKRIRKKEKVITSMQTQCLIFLFLSIVFMYGGILRWLLFIHFGPQGRYMFPVISAMGLFFAIGLKEIVPERFRVYGLLTFVSGLIILNIVLLKYYFIPKFY